MAMLVLRKMIIVPCLEFGRTRQKSARLMIERAACSARTVRGMSAPSSASAACLCLSHFCCRFHAGARGLALASLCTRWLTAAGHAEQSHPVSASVS